MNTVQIPAGKHRTGSDDRAVDLQGRVCQVGGREFESARVDAGGHDVPPEKLASRYRRLSLLIAASTPSCYRTVFWDNAPDDGPFEVTSYRVGIADHPPRWRDWTPQALLES